MWGLVVVGSGLHDLTESVQDPYAVLKLGGTWKSNLKPRFRVFIHRGATLSLYQGSPLCSKFKGLKPYTVKL